MLTFLAPAALAGLSLLAIPIVIHSLKPRKVRRTPFSSLRWLHLTQQRLSRRLRWHQLFLFLLRAAFISLLVFAVAKPMLVRHSDGGPRERFVILDVSRSMGYRAGDKPSPLDIGKQAAAKMLAEGDAEDRAALLTFGKTTKILGLPAPGGERYVAKLSSVEAEPTDTDLGSALDAVRTLLSRSPADAPIELFIVTDNHPGSRRPGSIESFVAEFPDRVKATIVNAAEADAVNGWIADARYWPAESGSPPVVDVQLRAVGAGTERTVRLTGATGLNERSQTIALDPARPTDVRFELPADFDPHGKSCQVVLDPPDGLPSDDRWFVSFDGGAALNVLIVEGRPTAVSGELPGFALRTAIAALSTPDHSIRVVSKKFDAVEPADLAEVDAVLLADVPELSDVALEALTEKIHSGAGLGVFLGPGVDAEFYNRRLIDPLDRAKSLLPFRLDRVVDVPMSAGGLAPIEGVAWNHPLLTQLFDPTVGDLALVGVRSYYRFDTPPQDAAGILATTGGAPFLLEHAAGQGKVVVFNTTADDAWSDLPRRKSFVPLVDRLLNHLSGGALRRTFQTGEAVALMLPPLAAGETVSIVAPGGDVLTPNVAAVGRGTRVTLPPLQEPGVYQVRRDGVKNGTADVGATSFVVQVGRGDSAIVPLDMEVVKSWWQPAPVEVVRAEAVGNRLTEGPASLVVWAVLLAALLFVVETLVVHRLCPKMNPRVAESVVKRRPIVSSSRAETVEPPLTPAARPV